MSKVLITKDLLDDLADVVAEKTDESTPMTIEDMTDAVDGITKRSASDVTVSITQYGVTVTTPAGLYASQVQKLVANGTAGTPTATKGTVSNHQVSVTPSVTNTTGYITGSTKTGTAVTVSASELDSGTKSITQNGTGIDVIGYAAVDVAVSGGGGDEFIITLEWDDDYYGDEGGAWIPDCTFAQVEAAYLDGMEIVAKNDDMFAPADIWIDSEDPLSLFAEVVWFDMDANQILMDGYYWSDESGWMLDGRDVLIIPQYDTPYVTYTPTESEQYTNVTYDPNDYNGIREVYVTVNAIPSNYVGSGITRRSSSDLSASGATVTAPAGYYASNATNTVASGTAGTPTATKGTVSNHSVSVTPSVTNTTGYITGSTKTGTAVTVSASELVSGSETKTANGTYDVTNLAEVVVNVAASSGAKIGTATATPSSASASISFTGLQGEPTSFAIVSAADLATGASPYKSSAVVFDGTNIHGQYITNTSNAQMTASDSAFSKSYSNGTLTVTGTGTNWQANQYKLMYSYDGSSSNIGTSDVQVGSGATSITFTNLPDEPTAWSCIFKSNIGTSSGYTRALVVVNDGTSIYGMEMGSSAQAEANWSASYSNGSLTISSQSTTAGGYFHQPGYYQLTYVIGGEISIDVEPLTVTQNGTYSESGKAYSPVVVNVASGGGANFGTVTMTNSSNQATSIDFTLPSGRTPKAFFARLTSQIARNSNSRYYYVYDMRWDGSSTGGVEGNTFYMYNGTLTNVTSGYSYSQSGTTFTLSTTGSRSASPGSFYNGTYELVYVY